MSIGGTLYYTWYNISFHLYLDMVYGNIIYNTQEINRIIDCISVDVDILGFTDPQLYVIYDIYARTIKSNTIK